MTQRLRRSGGRLGRAAALALSACAALGLDALAFQDGPGAPAPGVKLGLNAREPGAFEGYTLIAPLKGQDTYLIDNDGRVVHSWEADASPAATAYLLENGHLFRPAEDPQAKGGGGPAAGGRIQEFDWDGNLVWDFRYSDDTHRPHHDAIKLPNGNALMVVWEKKSPEEAADAGRRAELTGNRPLQADCLVEVRPTGPTTGEVVWEWHLWDHLVQDYDDAKPNYARVADHPELVDVNFNENALEALLATPDGLNKLRTIGYVGGGGKAARIDPDWTHVNGIDYNPELDQVILSVHGFSELWVIDHGTTTAEAAGHSGGKAGKGGDLLYRWGNPLTYRTGEPSDRALFHQHNAHWIPPGRPGAGHILVFNNGMGRPGGEYSTVEEIAPPVDARGRYSREPGKPFGPSRPVWSYSAPEKKEFYSALISGSQRLPNGDTLICSGNNGTVFEVTPGGETVWKYVNPVEERFGFGGPGGFRMPGPNEVLPEPVRDMIGLSKGQREELDALQKAVDAALGSALDADQMARFTERRGLGAAGFAPPGQLMALTTQITLKLSADQKAKVADLQKQIDAKLDSLLNDDQKAQLKETRDNFGRFIGGGPPGGPPGGGPPGGGPGGRPGGPPGGGPGGFMGGPPGGSSLFRAYRYAADYPGLEGRDLTPGPTIEELEKSKKKDQGKPKADEDR
jgi:hypothetical protein